MPTKTAVPPAPVKIPRPRPVMPKKGVAKLVERLRSIEWTRARIMAVIKGVAATGAAVAMIYGASTFYFADQEHKATTHAAKQREVEAREEAETPREAPAKPIPDTVLDRMLTAAADDPTTNLMRNKPKLQAQRALLVTLNADLDAWLAEAKALEHDRALINVEFLLNTGSLATPQGTDRARLIMLAFDNWRERSIAANNKLLRVIRLIEYEVVNGTGTIQRHPKIALALRRVPDFVSALITARQAETGSMRTIYGLVTANLSNLSVDHDTITMAGANENKRYTRALQTLREHMDDERSLQDQFDGVVFDAFFEKPPLSTAKTP